MTKEKFNDLLRKAKNGNKNTFAKVYNEFYPKMLYTAECITHNKEDAQDAVQQAFTRFWKYILGNDNPNIDYPGAYLQTITKRCAIEIVKNNDKYRTFDSIEYLAVDDTYEERTIINSTYKEAIEKLPEPKRTIAIHRFLFKTKVDDIVKIVKEPLGTVKWRISEIKKYFENTIK